ncbi:MAG TPA: HEAT repeat domain-containing protein [Thermomonospora sp.]|nr:HEAT repeat domain-containing protein [Thermomonospora sp.]
MTPSGRGRCDDRRGSRVEHQVAFLVGVLEGAPGWFRRYEAAQGLGTLWPRCAADADLAARWSGPVRDALSAAACDEHPWVRRAAIRGLERMGSVVPALEAALDDSVVEVRERAILAAGRVGPDAVVGRLIAMLRGVSPDGTGTVCRVVEALGQLRRPSAEVIEVLEDLGSRGDRFVVREALRSLARLARAEPRWAGRVTSLLRDALAAPDAERRASALHGLVVLKPAGWVDDCAGALADDNPLVRGTAVTLLLRDAGTWALRQVGDLVSDPDRVVRQRLAEALAAHVTEPAARAHLRRLVGDARPDVARAALMALARTGASAVRPVLGHPEPALRVAAASVLADIGDHHDLARLLGLLADPEPWVRAAAARALAGLHRRVHGTPRRLRSSVLAPMAVLLHDDDRYVRREAAHALGRLGDRNAIEHLHQACRDQRIDRHTAGHARRLLGL